MPITATPVVSITRPSPNPNEVTDEVLAKLKALLSIDFAAHDDRLRQCISSAYNQIEKLTGLLLRPGVVSVRWGSLYDYEQLPWGPVTGVVVATGLTGAGLTVSGLEGDFPTLRGDYPAGIVLTYPAGYDYDTLPEDLLESVLNLAANRFDQGQREWKSAALSHSRYTWAS